MPKKRDDRLTRAQAIERITDRFKRLGTIDPVVYALLSNKEQMGVLIGKLPETYRAKGNRALKALSVEQRAALDADLHSGMTFAAIGVKHDVPVDAVSVAYAACYKRKTHWVRVR